MAGEATQHAAQPAGAGGDFRRAVAAMAVRMLMQTDAEGVIGARRR